MTNIFVVDFFNLIKRYTYLIEESPDDGEFYSEITTRVINRILKYVKEYKIDLLVFCSDSGFNFRANSVLGGEYKANRNRAKSLTQEERENSYIEKLKDILASLPNIFIEVKDVEADNIAYLTIKYLSKEIEDSKFYVGTTDSDFLQLLSDRVNIVNWAKGLITVDNWKEIHNFDSKYFKPEDYSLLKSIVGDTSDNIKGVKGLGWKTAIKLLDFICSRIGESVSLDNIQSVVSYLENLRDNYSLSKKELTVVNKFLTTIVSNIELINRNYSIISLDMLETPYVARVMTSLDVSMKTPISFNQKEFLDKIRFSDRYMSDEDYNKILKKNLQALYDFKRLAARSEKIRREHCGAKD